VNFDALKSKLPLNLADVAALALRTTVFTSLFLGSSLAACCDAFTASSNLPAHKNAKQLRVILN
jgi:hypothetical protein